GTLASGVPLSVTQTNGRPIRLVSPKLDGSVSSRLGDKRDASGKALNPYFNTNAFLALPDQYTISPEPPALDELRAPGTKSLNLALFKARRRSYFSRSPGDKILAGQKPRSVRELLEFLHFLTHEVPAAR